MSNCIELRKFAALVSNQTFFQTGFALGSVEGRVAIQYVNPQNPKENFTFKCHRVNGANNSYQDVYAVSNIYLKMH